MKRKNNWQKLWGVLSILFLMVYLPMAWQGLPTRSTIEEEWANAIITVITKQPGNTYQFRDTYYPDMPTPELIQRMTNTYSKYDAIYEDIHKENTKYTLRIENLWASNALPLLFIFLIGFASIVALFVLVRGLAWLVHRLIVVQNSLWQRLRRFRAKLL